MIVKTFPQSEITGESHDSPARWKQKT